MSWRGILYSRLQFEHINPSKFDQDVTPQIYSIVKNSLGEEVPTYTNATPLRALVGKMGESNEKMDEPTKNLNDVAILITWYDPVLLDTKNKVIWQGTSYEITDSAEVYGRKRFVRLRIIAKK